MTVLPYPRPRFKVVKASAGSILAAASVAAITAFSPVPSAQVMAPTARSSQIGTTTAGAGVTTADRRERGTAGARLRGVQDDLTRAVNRGHVTQAQADKFTAQLAGRIFAGF